MINFINLLKIKIKIKIVNLSYILKKILYVNKRKSFLKHFYLIKYL